MEDRTMRLNLQTILAWSEEEAQDFLVRWRWIDGIVCPKCGSDAGAWTINRTERNGHQRKVYKCKSCRRQFSATVGTIFEDSHIPLNKWIGA
ncbi:MAG: transposase, partial [Chloroflexi bacterium]|nr:transposase [Chloroflexota bacterium]